MQLITIVRTHFFPLKCPPSDPECQPNNAANLRLSINAKAWQNSQLYDRMHTTSLENYTVMYTQVAGQFI